MVVVRNDLACRDRIYPLYLYRICLYGLLSLTWCKRRRANVLSSENLKGILGDEGECGKSKLKLNVSLRQRSFLPLTNEPQECS